MLKSNFIFILFPPGLGGNHFKNMIGLYTNLYSAEEIVPFYNDKNITAHAVGSNLQKDYLISVLKDRKHTILLCGHIGEYITVSNFFNQIPNRNYIVFNWSDNLNKVITNRLKKLDYVEYKNGYFLQEQQYIYNTKIISKIIEYPFLDILTINFQDLLSNNIIYMLNDIASKLNLERNHNVDVCEKLHNKWLTNNKFNLHL